MNWKNFKDELPETNVPFILCHYNQFMRGSYAVDMTYKQIRVVGDVCRDKREELAVYSEFYSGANPLERYQTGEYFWCYFPKPPEADLNVVINIYIPKGATT